MPWARWNNQDWTSWSVSLTSTGTTPNLGTTGTITGAYQRNSKTIIARIKIMFAGTGVSAGTGNYRLNLPVNTGSGDMRNIGQYWLYDSSAAAVSFGAVDTVSASSVYLMNTGGSVGATVPWTWAVNDEMAITLVYEGA